MDTRHALVADDNVSLADTVGEILSDHGFEVKVVSSGKQVLVAWRKHPADVAVLDVDLPDIGGLTLARRLVRRQHHCGLVLMSARDPEVLLPRVEAVGAQFLPKPFSPRRLIEVVERILREQIERLAGGTQPPPLLDVRLPRGLLEHFRRRR